MRDPVAQRAAVRGFRALERPRDADEVAAGRIVGQAQGRVAVAAHVEELQVRREIRVGRAQRGLQVAGPLVLEARAHAVAEQQVDRRLRLAADVGDVERAQRVVLGEAVLVGLDDARCRDRAGDERDADGLERAPAAATSRQARPRSCGDRPRR